MECVYQKEDKLLRVKLTEEIDHHVAEKIRRRVDYEIQRYIPKKVVFDFGNVNFMDSAGIGLIIGRYKMVSMLRRNFCHQRRKQECEENFRNVWNLKDYYIRRKQASRVGGKKNVRK